MINMKILTRKNGLWLSAVGVVVFLSNFFTYSLWQIDIDILGVVVFILGLLVSSVAGTSMKNSTKLFSRKGGLTLSLLAMAVTMLMAYSPIPYLNGPIGFFSGFAVFIFGLIIILTRWKH